MFEEDLEWSAVTPDPFEEDLHCQLFGTIKQSDTAARGEGNSDRRKRKRRTRDAAKDHVTSEEENASLKMVHKKVIAQPVTKKRRTKQRKVDHLEQEEEDSVQLEQNGTAPPPHQVGKKSSESSKLYAKMSSKLEGSHFRTINQTMYTSSGADAKLMFDSEPELFQVYHRGFNAQVSKWPLNPVDRVIDYIKSLLESLVVCDFGCGEARLAESVQQKVHSFDLVAVNDRVTACDMAHVPLKKHTVDICIFCLSLMGVNVSDFILEARRVIKRGGELRIVEVLSRFSSVSDFTRAVEAFGFKLQTMTEFSKMFVELVFTAVKWDMHSDLPQISLKPCVYKRR